jgi:hypothetical protein
MNFFGEIDKEASAWNTKGRNVIINLAKKDAEAEYWPRITKEKVKNSRIAVDWAKWVDEDEEGAQADAEAPAGFDPSMMQGFGGPGGAGGMPGMGGMGGMGGMPGMEGMGGGAGGMDMASMMQAMQGMGGAGGAGSPNMEGMDMAKMMQAMQGMGGAGGMPGMGMPDSDDEDGEEEAEGEPKKDDALADLDEDAEKK